MSNGTRLSPQWLVDLCAEALGGSIDIDPCTTEDNPVGATVYYTEAHQCPRPFPPAAYYVNPPWQDIERWARLAGAVDGKALLVTGSDVRTKWFRHLSDHWEYLVVLRRQVQFYDPARELWVEPSRGCLVWATGVPREDLEAFVDCDHLVLELPTVIAAREDACNGLDT